MKHVFVLAETGFYSVTILTGGEGQEHNETQPHELCQVSKYNLKG